MADKATQELERIYTIPLRTVKTSPRNHQTDRAIRYIRSYLTKHMKADNVWIDASVNEAIWAHGMYEIPSRIRVRARKFDDGVVEVSLPDIEVKESIRTAIKERQEKAQGEKEEAEEKAKKGEAAETKAEEKPAPEAAETPEKKAEATEEKPKPEPKKTEGAETKPKPEPKNETGEKAAQKETPTKKGGA